MRVRQRRRARAAAAMAALALALIALPSTACAQSISASGFTVTRTPQGYKVVGTVIASGLNPKGQIPESDDVVVYAEIKTSPTAEYPELPTSMAVQKPADAETPYVVGDRFLTTAQYEGVDIVKVPLASIRLRQSPVWSAYGGIGVWEKRAPSKVTTSFEGLIPREYEGKECRIRVTLTHVWGGPNAYWPAYSFDHAVLRPGTLKKLPPAAATTDAEGSTPSRASTRTQSVAEIMEESRKLLEEMQRRASSRQPTGEPPSDEERKKAGMVIFKDPTTGKTRSGPIPGQAIQEALDAAQKRQEERIRQLEKQGVRVIRHGQVATSDDGTKAGTGSRGHVQDASRIPTGETGSPGSAFKSWRFVDKYGIDTLIDALGNRLPGGSLVSDKVKQWKDDAVYPGSGSIDKDAADYNMTRRQAALQREMGAQNDREKAFDNLKKVPLPLATKPMEWFTDMLGGVSKASTGRRLRNEEIVANQAYDAEFARSGDHDAALRAAVSEVEENRWSDANDLKRDYQDVESRVRIYLADKVEQ